MNLKTVLQSILHAIRSALFPARCIGCANLSAPGEDAVCAECSRAFAASKLVPCEYCGTPVSACRCRSFDHGRLQLYSMLAYRTYGSGAAADPASRILLSRKTHLDDRTEEFLARHMQRMVGCIRSEHPEVLPDGWLLTYPPRSHKKRSEVGHDQSEEMAKRLSEMTGIPYCACIARRAHEDTAQKTLGAAQRMENAKNSYCIKDGTEPCFSGRFVIIIDDIATTGATLCTCASLLREAGALDTAALTAARTVHTHKNEA